RRTIRRVVGERRPSGAGRDEFIDFCRALSLIVVVLWHWVFTILFVGPDRGRAGAAAPAVVTQAPARAADASLSWRPAWYDDRTRGPASTCAKPTSCTPNRASWENSSGVTHRSTGR